MSDWLQALAHPQAQIVKQFLYQIIKSKWTIHEEIVDRVSAQLVTTKDIEAFNKMLLDIYEAGYLKSVEDHRVALQKIGVKVDIVPEQPPSEAKKIFKQ